MGSPEFPLARIHAVAAASCACWFGVSLLAHAVALACWKGYRGLRRSERLQFCNKVASGLHAAGLVWHQARNLRDPVLAADPLNAVTSSHFFWASVLAGYLLYDTIYSLAFFRMRSGAAFLLHHAVGLAGCGLGLYASKLALFGTAIEVFFEATTPLLHVLGCLKIARLHGTRLYRYLGLAFVAQFFLLRVLVSNYYLAWMTRTVLALQQRPWWAWAGVAVFGVLNALNAFWFLKLLRMAAGKQGKAQPAAAKQPGGEPGWESKPPLGTGALKAQPGSRAAVHVVAYVDSGRRKED